MFVFCFLPIAPEERSMAACTAGCGAMVSVRDFSRRESSLSQLPGGDEK